MKRTVPAVLAVVALGAAVLSGHDSGPTSLRVAADNRSGGTEDEGPARGPGQNHGGDHGEEPGLRITPSPVSDEPIEVPLPESLPLVPANPPQTQGPHLVDDPEGDDAPSHDAIDLRYGEIHFDGANNRMRFDIGVSDMASAPVGVGYSFRFTYDDIFYVVGVERRESRPTPVVFVSGHPCDSCAVVFDAAANQVRMDVPLAVLNERIAADSPRNYSAAWPTGHRRSPPLAQGSTIYWFRLHSYVLRGGHLEGTDQTQPHDFAESDESWVVG